MQEAKVSWDRKEALENTGQLLLLLKLILCVFALLSVLGHVKNIRKQRSLLKTACRTESHIKRRNGGEEGAIMKKMLLACLVAVGLVAVCEQRASAWTKFNFGVGLNLSYEGGGNSL